MNTRTSLLVTALLAIAATSARATTTIDQTVAMAGTLPGDGAGFPITITQPGHYVLTSNLVVPLNVNAIVIEADGVTLDLGGHSISSEAVCEQNMDTLRVNCRNVRPIYDAANIRTSSGVVIEGKGTVVRNGVVNGFRAHGVLVTASNVRIDGVRAASNQYHGIALGGPLMHVRISDSAAYLNGNDGLNGGGALIERTTSSNNGGSGVRGWSLAVLDSIITYNGQHGLEGTLDGTIVGVRGSLVFGNKPLNMGPRTLSMGNNHRGDVTF